MPLTKLTFQPGLDTLDTETGAEGRWVDCDKIRFRYFTVSSLIDMYFQEGLRYPRDENVKFKMINLPNELSRRGMK